MQHAERIPEHAAATLPTTSPILHRGQLQHVHAGYRCYEHMTAAAADDNNDPHIRLNLYTKFD